MIGFALSALIGCGLFVCFFFFQAEDGIRDGHVTGVQTCALPISGGGAGVVGLSNQSSALGTGVWGQNVNPTGTGVIGLGNGLGSIVLIAGSGGAFTGSGTGAAAFSTTSGVGQAIYTEQFSTPVRV